jgi:tetratricopeptide (TPR) repeat protein
VKNVYLYVVKAETKGSSEYEYWKNEGNKYYRNGDFENAVRCFDEAAKIHPERPAPWYNMGMAYEQLGNRQASEFCKSRANSIECDLKLSKSPPPSPRKNAGKIAREQRLIDLFNIIVICVCLIALSLTFGSSFSAYVVHNTYIAYGIIALICAAIVFLKYIFSSISPDSNRETQSYNKVLLLKSLLMIAVSFFFISVYQFFFGEILTPAEPNPVISPITFAVLAVVVIGFIAANFLYLRYRQH